MSARIEELDHLGLPAVRLETNRGASAIISLVGGQVLSWRPTGGGGERLFLSPAAVLDGSTPIRGGIPVCFPQFADLGRLPKHGLLRTRRWAIKEQRIQDGYAMVTLWVSEDDASHAAWPYAFNCELTVLIEDDRLDLEFEVENTGYGSFVFTGALHTYLAVREVEEISLQGLYGTHYTDKTTGKERIRETGEVVRIADETDRIYRDAARPLTLHDSGRELAIYLSEATSSGGTASVGDHAPRVIIESDLVRVNILSNTVVISKRNRAAGSWSQWVRKKNADDEAIEQTAMAYLQSSP